MAAYWFAQYAAWLALLTPVVITLALRIGQVTDPAHKSAWLGGILGAGAALAMVAAPVWGAISDRTTARIGRRKLWIAVGPILLLSGLLIVSLATAPLMIGIGWVICQIGSNAGQAALNAVMSDVVPDRQRGLMSALLSGSMTAAVMTGVVLTQFTAGSPLLMFVVPWLVSPVAVALFIMVVPDRPAQAASPVATRQDDARRRSRRNPLGHPDFAWAFSSRFAVMLSASFVSSYQVYYLTDHLHLELAQVARFMSIAVSLMGVLTLIVSLLGGWLSDRISARKPFVAFAAFFLAVGLLWMAFATDFSNFLFAAAIVSVGQGLYMAVDIALCVAVLPDREDAGRDMSVLQIANSLPQSLAPSLAPFLLAIGAAGGSNYLALFLFAALSAMVGALTIIPIRGAR